MRTANSAGDVMLRGYVLTLHDLVRSGAFLSLGTRHTEGEDGKASGDG